MNHTKPFYKECYCNLNDTMFMDFPYNMDELSSATKRMIEIKSRHLIEQRRLPNGKYCYILHSMLCYDMNNRNNQPRPHCLIL